MSRQSIIGLFSQVALVEVVVSKGEMGWVQTGAWLTLPEYVADHTICKLACNILSQLLSAMKVKGHSQLSHRLKAELFLRHMGKSAEEIESILQHLVIRTRKKKDPDTVGHDDDADADHEDIKHSM